MGSTVFISHEETGPTKVKDFLESVLCDTVICLAILLHSFLLPGPCYLGCLKSLLFVYPLDLQEYPRPATTPLSLLRLGPHRTDETGAAFILL